MTHPPILQTRRVRLWPLGPEHLEDLVRLDGDPEVMRYINGGKPTSRCELETVILPRILEVSRSHEKLGFWAGQTEHDDFIGWFHLRPFEGSRSTLELGYRLKRSVWGQGHATEVGRALLKIAFEHHGARKVVAVAMRENKGSVRVMEKLGLTYETRYRHSAGMMVDRYAVNRPD